MQIRKILFPTDFSDCADQALDHALSLARAFDAELTVLHVLQSPIYPIGSFTLGATALPTIEEDLRAKIREHLQTYVDEKVGRDVRASGLLREGNSFMEIVAVAEEREIDLIVLATHGHTGLKHVLLGSTAENVVRHAPCPVLSVRAERS